MLTGPERHRGPSQQTFSSGPRHHHSVTLAVTSHKPVGSSVTSSTTTRTPECLVAATSEYRRGGSDIQSQSMARRLRMAIWAFAVDRRPQGDISTRLPQPEVGMEVSQSGCRRTFIASQETGTTSVWGEGMLPSQILPFGHKSMTRSVHSGDTLNAPALSQGVVGLLKAGCDRRKPSLPSSQPATVDRMSRSSPQSRPPRVL